MSENNTERKKIYLAGWDVFRPDSIEFGKKLKAFCEANNLEGLYPLDNELPKEITAPRDIAAWIYQANIGLIQQADYVMANVENFRGAEPDSGTAFEIGYAHALGKKVYIYMQNTASMVERMRSETPEYTTGNKLVDRDGYAIENFDLPVNLMLSVPSVIVQGNCYDAVLKIREDLDLNLRKKPTI